MLGFCIDYSSLLSDFMFLTSMHKLGFKIFTAVVAVMPVVFVSCATLTSLQLLPFLSLDL